MLITWTLGVLVVALVGIWAWRAPQYDSVEVPSFNTPNNAQRSNPKDAHDQPLNPDAFNIALWNPPESPEESGKNKTVKQKPAPPSRLNVQLVAIIHDNDTRRAALYDPSTERLAIFNVGQTLKSGPTITEVTDVYVDLEASGRRHRLTLSEEDRS